MSTLEKEPSDPNRLKTLLNEVKKMFLRSYLYKLFTEERKHDTNRQEPVELCLELTITGHEVDDHIKIFLKDVANSYLLRKKQKKLLPTGFSYTRFQKTVILHPKLENLTPDLITEIRISAGNFTFPNVSVQTHDGDEELFLIIVPEDTKDDVLWILNK